MKDHDKPKKSAAIASKAAKRKALPVRAARPTPMRGEVLAATKEVDALPNHEPDIPLAPRVSVESPEPSMRLARRWRFSSRIDPNLDTAEPVDHNQSREFPVWEEYLDVDTSSSDLEILSEYSAEGEVEAAMLEAELAMQTDESALMFEESIEALELAQDGVSCESAEEYLEVIAVEEMVFR